MVLKATVQKERPKQSLPKVTSEASFRNIYRKTSEILQYSQKKHLCWGLILINLQALRPTTLFKKDFITGVSCEYYDIYTNTNSFFYGTLRLLLLLVWWSSCSVTDSICRSSLLNQKHKCGMVSTKKVSRSVQSMLFTRD